MNPLAWMFLLHCLRRSLDRFCGVLYTKINLWLLVVIHDPAPISKALT